MNISLVTLLLKSIFQVRFKDADISDAFVSGWGLRAQRECTTIDKVHSEQDQKNLFGKFIMIHYYQEASLLLTLQSYPVPASTLKSKVIYGCSLLLLFSESDLKF